jgi:hypothetical protein
MQCQILLVQQLVVLEVMEQLAHKVIQVVAVLETVVVEEVLVVPDVRLHRTQVITVALKQEEQEHFGHSQIHIMQVVVVMATAVPVVQVVAVPVLEIQTATLEHPEVLIPVAAEVLITSLDMPGTQQKLVQEVLV